MTFHRDDQPAAVRAAADGAAPVVLAEVAEGGLVLLAARAELDGCGGSPNRLVDLLEAAAAERHLAWPA